MATQESTHLIATSEGLHQDIAGQSDFSDSSDYVYIDQLDGSKAKKYKKKGKTAPEEEPAEAVEPGAVSLPRGLMVMAYDSNNLDQGFPFPKVLFDFGLLKNDWLHFVQAISKPLKVWSDKQRGHAYEADAICDIASEWDIQYFRKKGLLMRIDMPGEQNYGLDFMDLYYEGTGNRKTFNVSHGIAGTLHKDKMKTSKSNSLARVRDKGFESTRIVMDPISVLNDKKLYEQRGWARWDKASAHARKARATKVEVPVSNEPFKPFRTPEASFLNLNPSDPGIQMNSPRVDRWPTSKHFYYDRFRAQRIQFTVRNGEYSWATHTFWIPASDSMDQRAQGVTAATLACDELPREIVRPMGLYKLAPTS